MQIFLLPRVFFSRFCKHWASKGLDLVCFSVRRAESTYVRDFDPVERYKVKYKYKCISADAGITEVLTGLLIRDTALLALGFAEIWVLVFF